MIDWSIAQNALAQPDPGQRFMHGFQMAQEGRRRQEADAQQMRQREAQAKRQQDEDALAQLERHRDSIIKGARIVREINPQDEAGWQRARAMAAQLGIPLDEVPATFDPAYVQNLVKVADTFAPRADAEEDLVVIDGVAINKRTGQPMFESPYSKIVSGPGGIYEQPRIGIGRGGQGAPPPGRVVQGELPPGWTVIDDEGGAAPATGTDPFRP